MVNIFILKLGAILTGAPLLTSKEQGGGKNFASPKSFGKNAKIIYFCQSRFASHTLISAAQTFFGEVGYNP